MTPAPRRRRSAATPNAKTVKATVIVDVDTHVRWAAAAAMAGMDRSAWAANVLREALRGVVVVDRRRNPGPAEIKDRPNQGGPLESDGEIAA